MKTNKPEEQNGLSNSRPLWPVSERGMGKVCKGSDPRLPPQAKSIMFKFPAGPPLRRSQKRGTKF